MKSSPDLPRAQRLPTWERNLSGAVSSVFVCTAPYGRQYCKEKDRILRVSFVDVTPAQHIALYAFETLLTKVKYTRKKYVAAVRAA